MGDCKEGDVYVRMEGGGLKEWKGKGREGKGRMAMRGDVGGKALGKILAVRR